MLKGRLERNGRKGNYFEQEIAPTDLIISNLLNSTSQAMNKTCLTRYLLARTVFVLVM